MLDYAASHAAPASQTQPLTLNNIKQWQYQSKSQQLINGYYRPGHEDAQRIHLLHGTGFCAMTLAAMASQMPTDWSIWLTDIPGHGGSTQPSTKMPNWQKMANRIADAIYQQANVREQGPLIGIGHSMGGVLTLMAAAKYPDLFSKIILLDPVLFQTEIIVAQQLMRATGAWRQRALVKSVANRTASWPSLAEMKTDIASKGFYKPWHQQAIEDYCQYASHNNNQGGVSLNCDPSWEASIFGSYPKGLWRAVHKINMPVEILVANKTYFFIPKAVKRAAKFNHNIQWQNFGDHHCFPMEQPIETAALITTLLSDNA
ncbi:Pimeloyl-ACP methyl ester carboxylesterase [Colwellia chukchiensis]|uniref:Pimeloyl-ACP methyl ester carboxylesterase n=1 Tax=Colwellia chukchiensis TaxID=641665 RepID=A0A1H7R237_9GAMM|nr:alpha/beta hydrolase [Colwellia chukchiensis]SEL54232.1 Pimeloyl-ACP methyl ester carboxylesterase [Colwellia chukchiensis]